MTRSRAKELLPIIKAFAEGEEIQFRDAEGREDRGWITVHGGPHCHIIFDGPGQWRIKPKPREWWIEPVAGWVANFDANKSEPKKWVRVLEVLE